MQLDTLIGGAGWVNAPRRDRLVVVFELLMLLPSRPPGVTNTDIAIDLHVSRRTVFRLIAHLRASGIEIESSYLPTGRTGYFLGRRASGLLLKLGIE